MLTFKSGLVPSDLRKRSNNRQYVILLLMLMPVSFKQRLPHFIPFIHLQCPIIDHVIANQIRYLLHGRGVHIQHHCAIEDEAAQLEERVQREGCNMRFRPAITTLLHVFLEFNPAGGLLPFHLVALPDQLLHFGEERVTFVCVVIGIFAKDELHSLRWRCT